MSRRRWEDVRQDFRAIVAREGVEAVARRIPAHRSTVYRLVKGESRRPVKAIFAAVERVVADATKPESNVSGLPPSTRPLGR